MERRARVQLDQFEDIDGLNDGQARRMLRELLRQMRQDGRILQDGADEDGELEEYERLRDMRAPADAVIGRVEDSEKQEVLTVHHADGARVLMTSGRSRAFVKEKAMNAYWNAAEIFEDGEMMRNWLDSVVLPQDSKEAIALKAVVEFDSSAARKLRDDIMWRLRMETVEIAEWTRQLRAHIQVRPISEEALTATLLKFPTSSIFNYDVAEMQSEGAYVTLHKLNAVIENPKTILFTQPSIKMPASNNEVEDWMAKMSVATLYILTLRGADELEKQMAEVLRFEKHADTWVRTGRELTKVKVNRAELLVALKLDVTQWLHATGRNKRANPSAIQSAPSPAVPFHQGNPQRHSGYPQQRNFNPRGFGTGRREGHRPRPLNYPVAAPSAPYYAPTPQYHAPPPYVPQQPHYAPFHQFQQQQQPQQQQQQRGGYSNSNNGSGNNNNHGNQQDNRGSSDYGNDYRGYDPKRGGDRPSGGYRR